MKSGEERKALTAQFRKGVKKHTKLVGVSNS